MTNHNPGEIAKKKINPRRIIIDLESPELTAYLIAGGGQFPKEIEEDFEDACRRKVPNDPGPVGDPIQRQGNE